MRIPATLLRLPPFHNDIFAPFFAFGNSPWIHASCASAADFRLHFLSVESPLRVTPAAFFGLTLLEFFTGLSDVKLKSERFNYALFLFHAST